MENQHFFYRENGELKQIFPDQIAFFLTENQYTNFYVDGDKVMVRISLDDAMKMLPKNMFIRVSRSAAVGIQYIKKITRESVFVRTDPQVELGVSKQYYKDFIKQIAILQTNPNRGRKKKDQWEEREG